MTSLWFDNTIGLGCRCMCSVEINDGHSESSTLMDPMYPSFTKTIRPEPS